GTNLTFKKVISAFGVPGLKDHAYTLSIQASDECLYDAMLAVPESYEEKDFQIYYIVRLGSKDYYSFSSFPKPTPLPLVDPTWCNRHHPLLSYIPDNLSELLIP
ncbi:hypothetical protein TorRG33x02_307690, partial [Trema orientale]